MCFCNYCFYVFAEYDVLAVILAPHGGLYLYWSLIRHETFRHHEIF